MAFLGGLMRGPAGAFVRGSLDTATNIIQANAERDEKGIEERIRGFGVKKKAYDDGLNAFNSETKKIDSIAQALSVQDDEFIKNASPDELNSIARSLINLSGGKDPIDFYLKNRDKLSIKPLKSPTQTVVETPDIAQTEDALAAAETPVETGGGFDSFMGRLFGGANEEEIEQRAAKKLGMSIEQYRKVIAGTMPTRADPTAALAIAPTDKYKEVVDAKQSSVLNVITKPDFLRMENIQMPNGTVVTGRELAAKVMKSYETFSIDGAGGAEVSQLQNFALTTMMPPDVKGFFGEVHGTSISAISAGISDDKLSQGTRDQLSTISTELSKHMYEAATVPGYAAKDGVADTVNSLIIKGRKLLGAGTATDTRYGHISKLVEETVKHAREHSDKYTSDQLELIFAMPQQLAIATKNKDDTIFNAIENSLTTDFIPKVPEAGADKMSVFQEKVESIVRESMRVDPSQNEDEVRSRAGSFVAAGGLTTQDGIAMVPMVGPNGTITLQRAPIVSSGGFVEPRPKTKALNTTKIGTNNARSMDIGNAIQLTARNPNGFNIVGDIIMRTQDTVDIANSVFGTTIPGFETETQEITQMRQATIPLISTAKDQLFEDPRLSDQDLKIVLDYVAVINDSGIGSTRATQALIGLQEAMAMDTAMRMYQNNPSLTIMEVRDDGSIKITDDSGKLLENNISVDIMKNIAQSHGVKLLNKNEYEALPVAQRGRYEEQIFRVQQMTQRAMQRVNSFRDLNGDTEAYRKAYSNSSNLARIPGVANASTLADELEAAKIRQANRNS